MTAFPKVALIGPGAIGTTIAAALFERWEGADGLRAYRPFGAGAAH